MVPLHSAYLKVAQSGRARDLSQIEELDPRIGDEKEAVGVSRMYLHALNKTVHSLESGKFEAFDAVTGDHGCHRTALIAIRAKKELEELQKLKVPRQVNISKKGETPKQIIERNGYAFEVSPGVRYLVEAAILKIGTECIEHPDGSMTLTVNPQIIMDKTKGPEIDVVKKMITSLRESVNRYGVQYVQSLAPELFPRVAEFTTNRGENFQFISAFQDMNMVMKTFSEEGVHFLLVPYERKQKIEEPLYLFGPLGQRVDSQMVNPETPIFMIQGFGDREAVVQRGLFDFIRAVIATVPQYEADDGELPEEVRMFREEGCELMKRFRIAHTFATTLGKK